MNSYSVSLAWPRLSYCSNWGVNQWMGERILLHTDLTPPHPSSVILLFRQIEKNRGFEDVNIMFLIVIRAPIASCLCCIGMGGNSHFTEFLAVFGSAPTLPSSEREKLKDLPDSRSYMQYLPGNVLPFVRLQMLGV